jgi:hypothetical protein
LLFAWLVLQLCNAIIATARINTNFFILFSVLINTQ